MTRRNHHLVRYLWLCLELQGGGPTGVLNYTSEENMLLVNTFAELCRILRVRWLFSRDLLLDIDIHAASDVEYFKRLRFEPDLPENECDQDQPAGTARPVTEMTELFVRRIFDNVISQYATRAKSPAPASPSTWTLLPLVRAVTRVLVRQQSHRRWNPRILSLILSYLPNLEEVHYEPWREWVWSPFHRLDYCK